MENQQKPSRLHLIPPVALVHEAIALRALLPPPDESEYENPKDRVGIKKVPMHLVPVQAMLAEGEALYDGAVKYGAYNWREKQISACVYASAIERHMLKWWDGQNIEIDSGIHHVGHAKATAAILLDVQAIDIMVDDRDVNVLQRGNLLRMLHLLPASKPLREWTAGDLYDGVMGRLKLWLSGEDYDRITDVHNLGYARAYLGALMDMPMNLDNRPKPYGRTADVINMNVLP